MHADSKRGAHQISVYRKHNTFESSVITSPIVLSQQINVPSLAIYIYATFIPLQSVHGSKQCKCERLESACTHDWAIEQFMVI